MDAGYIESVLAAAPVRVFGYRLSVLRLCHLVGLELLDSPVLRRGVPAAGEVLLAARCCAARDLEDVRAALAGRVRWRDRWSVWWRSVWWARRAAGERAKLLDWLVREDAGPRMLTTGTAGERLASPWVELLVGRMCAGGRGDEAEVWRMRVARVLWADVALKEEASGRRANLLSDEEMDLLTKLGWDPAELVGANA